MTIQLFPKVTGCAGRPEWPQRHQACNQFA